MPIQHPTYALPLQSANTIATKQAHDAELNRVVTILVENDRDLNATFERAIVTGPIVGEWDAGTGAFPTLRPNGEQIRVGDTWRVIGNGTVDGQAFYSGDYLQAITAGGGVTFNGNWARAALGQIEADRIAAETAAAEAQAYAEMAEFTRVTVIASGDGTANPITLPISVDSALRVQVFVNMTRWVPGDDYTVSGYDLAPVSPLVWPEGDRNLLIMIDRPFDSMAPTSEDVTHDGQPISQILDRIDADNTFYLSDYLHPDDYAAALIGNTGSQNEARVTAAVRRWADDGMTWWNASAGRMVHWHGIPGTIAINDEMFSDDFAAALWGMGGNRDANKAFFHGDMTIQCKSWPARARVRTVGLQAARGQTYAVPTVVFRWEQDGPRSYSPIFTGNWKFLGENKEATDPILFKIKAGNVAKLDGITVRGTRNIGIFVEALFNSDGGQLQVERCGFQPTMYGMGTGLIPNATRFQNVGGVITATADTFDASHVGLKFMLNGAGPSSTQKRQAHVGTIVSVDSATQITVSPVPSFNVLNPRPGSFEAVACSTTAGSNVITLTRGDIPSLVGRYITIGECGQLDATEAEVGSITAIVTAHSGTSVTLSHAVKNTIALAPLAVAPGQFYGRAAENWAVRNRTDDTTMWNVRAISGTAFDQQAPLAVISYASSVTFASGSKFHGSPGNQNNFGGNSFGIMWDYCSGVDLDKSIVAHSGYDTRFGKHIFVGGWIDVGINGDEVVYPDTTETATIYLAPYAASRMMRVFYGSSRNDGRVGNAVKARYGANGSSSMIRDYYSARPLKRGLPVENDNDAGPEPIDPGAATLAIPDWPRYLHDLRVSGDAFGSGWGSTRAAAAANLLTGWTPTDGAVYTIGGLQYLGQTGATSIADLPGLVWHGYKTNAITLAAPAITLGTGHQLAWADSGGTVQARVEASATALDAYIGATNALRVTSGGVQVTGLLTGTAVASSPTDATLGRLPVFLDYQPNQPGNGMPWGLGASHTIDVPGNDANAISRAGFYRVATPSTVANVPDSNFGGVIVHHPYSPNYAAQTFIVTNGANAGQFWIRHCTNGTWAAWRRVYTQRDVLGTVSQTGGVPTGALMQGNASAATPTGGWTERMADGFQTVHHTLTSSASADTTWTYNSAFLTGSTPVITAQPIGNANYFVRIVSRTETACVFSIRDAADNRVAVPVDLIARGRWSNMT